MSPPGQPPSIDPIPPHPAAIPLLGRHRENLGGSKRERALELSRASLLDMLHGMAAAAALA